MVEHGEQAAPRRTAGSAGVLRSVVRRGVAALATGALLLVTQPALARPTLDNARLDELGRYQVLTFVDAYQAGIDRGKAIGVFDATPEEVFRVATDFAHYKDFMPRITGAEQTARAQDGAQVVLTADLPWPAGPTWIDAEYRFERLAGQIYRIRFEMRRGNMKQYLGSLYIEPWSANKSSVTYELVAEPNVSSPKSFINKGVRRSVASIVHALRPRVNDLHHLGLLHPFAPQCTPALAMPATVIKPNPATLKARR